MPPGFYRIDVSTGSGENRRIGQRIVYIAPGTSPTFTFGPSDMRSIEAGQGTGVPIDQSRIAVLEVLEDLLRYHAFMQSVLREGRRLLQSIPAFPSERPVRLRVAGGLRGLYFVGGPSAGGDGHPGDHR